MKRLFLFLLIAFTGFSFMETPEEKYLFWKADIRLRWRDFGGHIKPEDEDAASASYIGFLHKIQKCEHADSVVLDTRAFFNKKMSWVKVPAVNPSLLTHEQLHFDLAELYSRKFRKAVMEIKANEKDFVLVADSLFRYYSAIGDSMHFAYDIETNHGLNSVSQYKWNRVIREDMTAMNPFESPIFKIALLQ